MKYEKEYQEFAKLITDEEDELSELFKTKFQDVQFNPRWECGIASHVEVIEYVD